MNFCSRHEVSFGKTGRLFAIKKETKTEKQREAAAMMQEKEFPLWKEEVAV